MLGLLLLGGDHLLPGFFIDMKRDGHSVMMFLIIRQDFSLLFLEMLMIEFGLLCDLCPSNKFQLSIFRHFETYRSFGII